MAVSLHQHERHAPAHGRQPHRPGHVAAGAEHGLRPGLAEQPARPGQGPGVHGRGSGGAGQPLAIQRGDRQRAQLVAGLRDQLEFGALPADERDLGPFSAQRVGHRQRRHDVPGGPAGADHDPCRSHVWGHR